MASLILGTSHTSAIQQITCEPLSESKALPLAFYVIAVFTHSMFLINFKLFNFTCLMQTFITAVCRREKKKFGCSLTKIFYKVGHCISTNPIRVAQMVALCPLVICYSSKTAVVYYQIIGSVNCSLSAVNSHDWTATSKLQ